MLQLFNCFQLSLFPTRPLFRKTSDESEKMSFFYLKRSEGGQRLTERSVSKFFFRQVG